MGQLLQFNPKERLDDMDLTFLVLYSSVIPQTVERKSNACSRIRPSRKGNLQIIKPGLPNSAKEPGLEDAIITANDLELTLAGLLRDQKPYSDDYVSRVFGIPLKDIDQLDLAKNAIGLYKMEDIVSKLDTARDIIDGILRSPETHKDYLMRIDDVAIGKDSKNLQTVYLTPLALAQYCQHYGLSPRKMFQVENGMLKTTKYGKEAFSHIREIIRQNQMLDKRSVPAEIEYKMCNHIIVSFNEPEYLPGEGHKSAAHAAYNTGLRNQRAVSHVR